MHKTYEVLQFSVDVAKHQIKCDIKKEIENLFDIAREKSFEFDEKEMGGFEHWDRITFNNPIELIDVDETALSIAQCRNDQYDILGEICYTKNEIHYVESFDNNYSITDLSIVDMLILYRAMLETLGLE